MTTEHTPTAEAPEAPQPDHPEPDETGWYTVELSVCHTFSARVHAADADEASLLAYPELDRQVQEATELGTYYIDGPDEER